MENFCARDGDKNCDKESLHISVLPREVIEALQVKTGGVYVDGTLGGGGHTALIADLVGANGLVISCDKDVAAIDRAQQKLQAYKNIRFVHADFRYVGEALQKLGLPAVDGICLDLGISSDQLADRTRGFRFDADGELDLRFDLSEGEPAQRLLTFWSEERIANTIFEYGEERFSRRIARAIVHARNDGKPIRTARELAELVARCVPRERRTNTTPIHPATRTFQALRIAVNDELGSLQSLLQQLPTWLAPQGRAAIISFHSLEDRIVKNAFRDAKTLNILTKKPIVPTEAEIHKNPRARSAKLRVAEKIMQG